MTETLLPTTEQPLVKKKRGGRPPVHNPFELFERYQCGETMEEIGSSLGISRQRVQQLLEKVPEYLDPKTRPKPVRTRYGEIDAERIAALIKTHTPGQIADELNTTEGRVRTLCSKYKIPIKDAPRIDYGQDLTDQPFGLLTAKRLVRKNGDRYWECDCKCGTTDKLVKQRYLTDYRTLSCGCLLWMTRSKPIEQYDPKTNQTIQRFPNIKTAAQTLRLNRKELSQAVMDGEALNGMWFRLTSQDPLYLELQAFLKARSEQQ